MKTSVLIVLLALCAKANSQQQEFRFEMLQLVKIAEVYRNAPNLSYNINYTLADSTAPTTYLEQLSGQAKISNGKYWTLIDSVEMLQGGFYRVTAYLRDSSIVVNDRQKYSDLFNLPFLDSAFRVANINTYTIYKQNDSTWEFTANFKPVSGYSKYTLQYDPRTYRTKQVKYFVKNTPVDETNLMTAVITMTMSSYSTASVDQTIFNEDRLVLKQNGSFVVRPAYTGFQIINNSSN